MVVTFYRRHSGFHSPNAFFAPKRSCLFLVRQPLFIGGIWQTDRAARALALAARRKRLPTTSPMETLVSIDDEMRLLYLCGEHDNFQFIALLSVALAALSLCPREVIAFDLRLSGRLQRLLQQRSGHCPSPVVYRYGNPERRMGADARPHHRRGWQMDTPH